MRKARDDLNGPVLLIDDDAAIQRGVRALLGAAEFAVEVFKSGEDFLARRAGVDLAKGVVLLDLCLPGIHGFEVQKWLRSEHPELPVIVMTGQGDIPIAVRAMRDGAVDFLEKPFAPDELLTALSRAFAIPRPRAAPTHVAPQLLEAYATLSAREREVLGALAIGETNKEIARTLGLSPRTVETHRRNIMAKTNARSLADLVRMSVALGLPK